MTQETLTGYCWGSVIHGAPNQCGTAQDTIQCPVGQLAKTSTSVSGCLPPSFAVVDTSTSCKGQTHNGESIIGECVVQ
jgi:hypothetical protein